jgi:transposase
MPLAAFFAVSKAYRTVFWHLPSRSGVEPAQLRERIAEQAAMVLGDSPDSRRLMTVPGIGPANALTILAEAGDLRRFRHHRQFLSFCGLNLSTLQSGKSRG